MDNESTKIVYERICKLEPEYGLKIVGYVMMNTNEQDMIRLAFSPDGMIQCVINKAKCDLGIPDVPIPYACASSSSSLFFPQPYAEFAMQNQMQLLSLEGLWNPANPVRRSRRSELPVKVCHYFNEGYCKHGNTCRYTHEVVEKSVGKSTRPLALMNRVRVLDRPHGQHSIILGEDAPKYMEISESSARQIYLTFPAESTFTEQDISNYFNKYGPVQDVRIPYQESRIYGFVTFVYAESVKQVLSTTSIHFVCGALVLAKPYKEKYKLSERKNAEKSPLTSTNTSYLPSWGCPTQNLAHSSGNAEMEEFSSSTEQPHYFQDSWTDHHDYSTEGPSEPGSPFASHTN